MTMVRVLPNRYIALLMTPREASMVEGQLLDPGDYPWQDDEASAVALGVKMQLGSAVANITMNELDASIAAITSMALTEEAGRTKARQEDTEEPPAEERMVSAEEKLLLTQEETTHG